jgi:hypothetical protein
MSEGEALLAYRLGSAYDALMTEVIGLADAGALLEAT